MPVHSQGTPLNISQRKKGVTGLNATSDNIRAMLPPVSPAAVRSALALAPFAPTRVTGISATTTPANNLRGTATFVAATTVAVVFGTAEADAAYFIALGGNAAGYVWPSAKATSGFTINCAASNSNPTDWILIR
jgi:hypothetical protein